MAGPGGQLSAIDLQRLKWKEKARRKRLKQLGQPVPPGDVTDAVALSLAAGAGATPAPRVLPAGGLPVAPVAAVAWQADTLKPLFEALVPALEKADVASLVKKAEKLDGALAKQVEKDAAWNGGAKTVAITAGPQCAAKWLNAAGIDSQYAPEVALGIAAITIFTGRLLLANKLDALLKEKRESDDRLRSTARVDAGDGQKRDGQNDVRPALPGSQN